MNKKIKNATPCVCDSITFKSKLEKKAYEILKKEGFNPLYECQPIALMGTYYPQTPLLTEGKKKLNGVFYKELVNNCDPIKSITYCPDFSFFYNFTNYIIEMKGKETEVFNIKFKLFRIYIDKLNKKTEFPYVVALLHNIESLKYFIKNIKK